VRPARPQRDANDAELLSKPDEPMSLVVLLRGANLGKRRFSPKAVEAALADLDLVNVGAAGTFVVMKRIGEKALRERIAAELPFKPTPMVILKESEIASAICAGEAIDVPADARRFATAMSNATAKRIKLPFQAPEGSAWGVRVVCVSGRFALGIRRRVDATGVYPNPIIEGAFGVEATTRDWPTMEKIAKLLAGPRST
jgi:hypothetical protein